MKGKSGNRQKSFPLFLCILQNLGIFAVRNFIYSTAREQSKEIIEGIRQFYYNPLHISRCMWSFAPLGLCRTAFFVLFI
jgi:hypothetical protein